MTTDLDLEELTRRQSTNLWLAGHSGIHTLAEAQRFMESVGFALRYNATEGLPLASMYRAVWDPTPKINEGRRVVPEDEGEAQRRAIELTNALLANGTAIEVNIIAGRLVLVHRKLVPALYLLRRRGQRLDDLEGLSINAARAYALIGDKKRATFGDIRRHFGITGWPNPDPAYEALAELQRRFLVDRGPADVPKKGIPYLSKEGIPYRSFHAVNKDLIRAAEKLSVREATRAVIFAYLKAAVFVAPRKLGSMFKLCFTRDEMKAALDALAREGKIKSQKAGKTEIVILT